MNFLDGIRVEKFEALATKTANCLLGFECGEENIASQATKKVVDSSVVAGRGFGAGPESADDKKAEENNKNQGGSTADEVNNAETSKRERMISEARQEDMNRKSKGPYFMIFILFMLLSAFSLGDEEEEVS